MINLIPPEGQRIVRREYLARVGAVFSLLATGALLAGALLLLPTYILLTHQLNTTTDQAAYPEAESGYAEATRSLADASRLAKRLEAADNSAAASEILAHIDAGRPSAVALIGLTINQRPDGAEIVARGTAETRESLRQFVDTLKRDAFFLDARVPVSDLARDTNLTFTLSLSLRTTGS